MLAVERHQRILEMLLKSGTVTTTRAAKALAISEETARRDFEQLEADGHLTRKHGGAISNNDIRRDLSLRSRQIANVAEKEIIAKLAVSQIQAGDTIFLDASSTTFHLACALPGMEVTVLTTALKTAVELARHPAIRVILAGGIVSHRSLSCEGSLTIQMLEHYHVQKAFLSCRGFDSKQGFGEANAEQAALKRKVMSMTDQTILLIDHSKFGVKPPYLFARPEDIDVLITNHPPDKSLQQSLQKNDKKLIVPKN
jgi:DeoR family transcriptional regulator, fructose operon transcriptional repressor